MWWFSPLAFVFASMLSAAAHSAECLKTFDGIKRTALEGELCASEALNDADRELNSSYQRMIRVAYGSHRNIGSMLETAVSRQARKIA
jgi:uncharacterized protein